MAITTKETIEADNMAHIGKMNRALKKAQKKVKEEQQRKRPVLLTNLFPGLGTKVKEKK